MRFSGLATCIGTRWPNLQYLSFGLYGAWILISVSSGELIFLSEAAGLEASLGVMYFSSGVPLTICLIGAALLDAFFQPLIEKGPLTLVMGLLASGCSFFLAVGGLDGGGIVLFVICGVGTGLGTAFVCLRVGYVTSRLNGAKALLTIGSAALLSHLVFFAFKGVSGIAAVILVSLLPMLAVLCSFCIPEETQVDGRIEDEIDIGFLPKGYFRRLVSAVLVLSLAVGVVKGMGAVSSDAMRTVDTSSTESLVTVFLLLLGMFAIAVSLSRKNFNVSKLYLPCGLLLVAGALLAPLVGGFSPLQVMVVNVFYNLFVVVVWCLLVDLAGRTTLTSTRVFGFGRGASALGTTVGQAFVLLGHNLLFGDPGFYAGLFAVMGVLIVLTMTLVLSEQTIEQALAKTMITGGKARTAAVSESDDSQGSATGFDEDHVRFEGRWKHACQSIADERKLTVRESEVLALLSRGRAIGYVSEELGISYNTSKGYAKSVYAKLGVHSRQELIDLVESFIYR